MRGKALPWLLAYACPTSISSGQLMDRLEHYKSQINFFGGELERKGISLGDAVVKQMGCGRRRGGKRVIEGCKLQWTGRMVIGSDRKRKWAEDVGEKLADLCDSIRRICAGNVMPLVQLALVRFRHVIKVGLMASYFSDIKSVMLYSSLLGTPLGTVQMRM